jgi:hypothetical protein
MTAPSRRYPAPNNRSEGSYLKQAPDEGVFIKLA